ncbi:hypothetical protein ACIBTV_30760 [Micromonospora sp. NPDC049366]|uniref:hypothetical protein n=1 Tax=Micromonospora sp. NPDC049366 TaxID=3364271 RepID=UPI0037A11807
MGISQTVKRAAAGVAAAGMLTAATLAVTTGPAAAAMGKGRVQICAQGNYAAYLSFEGSRYSTSVLAVPGACVKTDIPTSTYQIGVNGVYNSGASFRMGAFVASSSDDPGWKVYTKGTTAAWWWYADRN